MVRRKITLKSMTLIPGVNKKECVLSSISDAVISLLISGVFSNHQLISNELFDLLINTIKVPTDEKKSTYGSQSQIITLGVRAANSVIPYHE